MSYLPLRAHNLLPLKLRLFITSLITMQALRKIFGVQSSSEFHDHGLRLLVPDVDDPEELQRSRSIESVTFLIVRVGIISHAKLTHSNI